MLGPRSAVKWERVDSPFSTIHSDAYTVTTWSVACEFFCANVAVRETMPEGNRDCQKLTVTFLRGCTRGRRFANSTCPIRTHRFSCILFALATSQLLQAIVQQECSRVFLASPIAVPLTCARGRSAPRDVDSFSEASTKTRVDQSTGGPPPASGGGMDCRQCAQAWCCTGVLYAIFTCSGFSYWISATHFSSCHRLSVRYGKVHK